MADTVEKNPLIQVYRALDKSDLRRLGKWLDSPIHNNRDDVRALHAYFVGDPNRLIKTSALGKTRIWKRIFPQETFDDARLRQTFHWALKATEGYLAYENWTRTPIQPQLALINELRRRGVSDVMYRCLGKASQLQVKNLVRNEFYFRNQYQLEVEKDHYRDFFNLRETPRFQEIADTLDVTYLIEKLQASWNMLFHQKVYRTQFKVRFLDEVVHYVQQLDLDKYPVLAIHYYGYRGLTEEDEHGENIARLRDKVSQYGDLLNDKDLRYVYLMAINLCIANANRGRDSYVRESFEWYRLGLEKDVISEDGLMTRATYLNVVNNALKLKEYDWTHNFIEQYTHQLEEDIRENTEYFARARLGYELKDYNTAMPLLVQVDFKHPVYNILAKTLLLKIYYELDEFDALDSQVDSMTTYIRRKELSDLHRNNFNSVARLTRQLSRLNPLDKQKKEVLRKRIEETSPLTEKKWLLEQLGKL
ncbi:MAG: hypothetical protein AAGF89_00110 [Bacteroidota bacterium]